MEIQENTPMPAMNHAYAGFWCRLHLIYFGKKIVLILKSIPVYHYYLYRPIYSVNSCGHEN